MEENKFDPYQFIGFVLIAIILTWMLYDQNPENEQVVLESKKESNEIKSSIKENSDSPQLDDLGEFSDVISLKRVNEPISIQNSKLKIKFNSLGGQIVELSLKDFTNHKGDSLYIIKNNNNFNVEFKTKDGRSFNSSDFIFEPELSTKNFKQVVTYRAKIGQNKNIEFIYELSADDFMINFRIKSEGLSPVLSNDQKNKFSWNLKAFRNSRSIEYENWYTELTYGYENEKMSYLSSSSSDEDDIEKVDWIGYKQHFFNAILVPENQIKNVFFSSENLVSSEDKNQIYTKNYFSEYEFDSNGEINENFKLYFGPSEFNTLNSYNLGIEKSIYFGWGIFGWINKYIFNPLFEFLSSYFPHGISIIIMTILVRLAMSPVTYKSYVSQIKMKTLRPEVEEINNKFKNDAVKRQQETMSLYNQAGANPMSGCLPALLQLPVFYALFSFFPVAFALRQKSFLWADDLSSYDSILDLPFSIPFYGDHISLFPILASIAIFIYTMMTAGQQATPTQPGMPNMKIIIYLMPLMMLFFFNNYASGLSLYYFVSNILTIILMLVIKNYIIDDNKIRLQIEENKKRPKKSGGFSARLQRAMEQAEKQKKLKRKR
ncbi:MAG: membrane protein insertase YidC [Flavobacteriaceae bacterium]